MTARLARHEDLLGGTAQAVLSRPGAVRTHEESALDLICLVETETSSRQHVRVLDLTSVDMTLARGASDSGPVTLELLLDGRTLWKGAGA